MSILAELNTLMEGLGLPVETGIFRGKAPEEYVVLTPLSDAFALWADDRPAFDVQEVRISLYSKGNYLGRKRAVERALLRGGFGITERRYIGHEDDTGYHHYTIDTEKAYPFEEEDAPWQP